MDQPRPEGAPAAGPKKGISSDATIAAVSPTRTGPPRPTPSDGKAGASSPETKDLGPRFAPGQRVGPYEIIRPLGKGAMGVVVVARHTELGREVALKVLSQGAAQDAEAVERFRRESEAIARLKHPGIVGMYERGEADGLHYYAMELVNGVSFEALIRRERVSYTEAARLISQCAHAMDFAHGAGVLHRDLKPANILLEDTGRARITDFGLARINQKATLTSDGIVVGTPLYLAPEVARGERASRQSDIYSLGATLYELATGKPPYKGQDARTVLLRVLSDAPAPPTEADPRVPSDLVKIISKAMARDPALRYPHARQLGMDLERFAQGRTLEIGGSAGAFKVNAATRHARSAGLVVVVGLTFVAGLGFLMYEHAKRKAAEREKEKAEKELKKPRPPEDKGLTEVDGIGVRALEARDARALAAFGRLTDDATDSLATGMFDERVERARSAARDNDLTLAIAKYREALTIFAHRWDVRLELARVLAQSDAEDAELEFSMVVQAPQVPKDFQLRARFERARYYRTRPERLAEWLAATDYRILLGSQWGDNALRSAIGADLALVSADLGDTLGAKRMLEVFPNLAGDDLARACLARAILAKLAKEDEKVENELAKARTAATSDDVKKAIDDFTRRP